MKTRGLFLSALLMGAVMAGCSNEEVLNNEVENSAKKSDNYVSVNIVAPGGFGSRGADEGFENGVGDESKVNDAIFLFYDASGNFVDASKADLNPWTDGNTGSIEKVSSAVIVLSNPKTWPTQMVTLLNTGEELSTYRNLDLDDMLDKIDDYSSTESFVMSNSYYRTDEGEITATKLSQNNICKTRDEAERPENAVQVYVERVLAKVSADASDVEYKGILDEGGNTIQTALDGKDVTFNVSVKGMALVHTNPDSYLIKRVESEPTWEGWNDSNNFRSYWATSAEPEYYETLSWNEVENEQSITEYLDYCHENTSNVYTKLLVAAQFTVTDSETGTVASPTVYKFNGTYFTLDALKTYIRSEYFGNNVATEDMSFVQATGEGKKAWHVELQLSEELATEYSEVLKSVNAKNISCWTDGKCYYYVDIEHFGNDGCEVGVVRNHWYQLTINSIAGLGTPVIDPNDPINPDRPEEENYYVAAQVNVLQWKVVSQNVDLK